MKKTTVLKSNIHVFPAKTKRKPRSDKGKKKIELYLISVPRHKSDAFKAVTKALGGRVKQIKT